MSESRLDRADFKLDRTNGNRDLKSSVLPFDNDNYVQVTLTQPVVTDRGWKLRLGAGGPSGNQRGQTHFALADILDCDFRRLLRPPGFLSPLRSLR